MKGFFPMVNLLPCLPFVFLQVLSVWPGNAREISPSHPIRGMTTRHGDMARRIQSFLIKQNSIPKSRIYRTNPSKANSQGSVLTLQKPTRLNLCRWFGVEEEPGNPRCMLQRQFNHDAVGMTNPCVKLSSEAQSPSNISTVRKVSKVSSVSPTAAEDDSVESHWWPSMSFAPSQPKKWRVLRYRRKVGRGLECYKRVRDAALDWEFKNGDEMGLMAVPTASVVDSIRTVGRGRYTVSASDEEAVEGKAPMHQCIGAARRFVSYSAKRITPFLPKVYSVNPVMIVYDVLDQRGPSTTFSSTAYATMRGHLLRGEERVTVLFRDVTEDVEVEILSVSREGPSAKGRLIWPFIGKMQSKFFESQMDHLQNIGMKNSQSMPSAIQHTLLIEAAIQ